MILLLLPFAFIFQMSSRTLWSVSDFPNIFIQKIRGKLDKETINSQIEINQFSIIKSPPKEVVNFVNELIHQEVVSNKIELKVRNTSLGDY